MRSSQICAEENVEIRHPSSIVTENCAVGQHPGLAVCNRMLDGMQFQPMERRALPTSIVDASRYSFEPAWFQSIMLVSCQGFLLS